MSTDDRSNDSPTSSEAEKVDTEGNADNAVVEGAVENVVDNDLVDEPTGDELAGDESAADERAGGGRLIVWCLVALLVGIGASAASGFWWYKNKYLPDERAQSEQMSALQAAQTDVSDRIDGLADVGPDESLSNALNALQTELSALRDTVTKGDKARSELTQSVSSLFEKETQTSIDWVLAEAEYLVLAATQRLALEGDINTAIAALRAADQRLRSADHPDLIPIRDKIIEDAAALEAVKLPDVEGLAIYLAKAIEQVKDLPTQAISDPVEPFAETKKAPFELSQWQRVASSMWEDLVNLVEVKDAALPDSVLFDPELRYFLQQNLQLELASARLAVLQRDGDNFRASTQLIRQMLTDYYDDSATSVQSMLDRLNEAEAYEFSPALPKITGSLDVIRAHRKQRAQNAQ